MLFRKTRFEWSAWLVCPLRGSFHGFGTLFGAFSVRFQLHFDRHHAAPPVQCTPASPNLGCGTAICKISRKLSPKNGACVFAATACSFLLPSDEWNTHWVALLPDLKVFCKFWSPPPDPPPGLRPLGKVLRTFSSGAPPPFCHHFRLEQIVLFVRQPEFISVPCVSFRCALGFWGRLRTCSCPLAGI